MFKKSNNPQIVELTNSYRKRRINLSELNIIEREGHKHCIWCDSALKGRQYKWCSNECGEMAWAWANPQSDEGLHILFVRQHFKCAICQYDYTPHLNEAIARANKFRKMIDPDLIKEKISKRLIKRLKLYCPNSVKPEVDHIVPIYKGGQSIGFENHQAACYTCHKTKSKVDNSGPRKKK